MPTVTIRYWAGARAAAGIATEQWSARSIAHALDLARDHRGSVEFARVVRISSVLVGGRLVRPEELDRALDGPVEVEILPPYAGG